MTNDTSNAALPRFAEGIAAAVAAVAASEMLLTGLSKAERDKVHRKNLRLIAFHQGLDGVKAYKAKHTEANRIQVKIETLAFSQKPKGYDEFLVWLVERWLTNEIALGSTNVADVGLLNDRLGTIFPPAKHFSEPLSKGRLKKIKAVFSTHQLPLDITKHMTMSKVREAAKAGHARFNADRPFGNVGVISGNTLIINQQSFAIELNGKRECIRVVIDRKRCRFYLNELEWIANLMVSDDDPLSDTTLCSIGELAYTVETAENGQGTNTENSGLAYGRSAFDEQTPDLAGGTEPGDELVPDDVDPLEAAWLAEKAAMLGGAQSR